GKGETNSDNPPVAGTQAAEVFPMQRQFAGAGVGGQCGFAHKEHQDGDGYKSGQHGDPEDQLVVVGGPPHQADSQQGANKSTNGIQSLTQAVGGTSHFRRGHICDQGIAWRTAYAFADTVYKAGTNQPVQRVRQRENGFGQGCQAIANDCQQFALSKTIADRSGKHFHDGGGGFGNTFDKADGQYRCTQDGNHVNGQQGVDQLRRNIHEHGHKTQRPDAAVNLGSRHVGSRCERRISGF